MKFRDQFTTICAEDLPIPEWVRSKYDFGGPGLMWGRNIWGSVTLDYANKLAIALGTNFTTQEPAEVVVGDGEILLQFGHYYEPYSWKPCPLLSAAKVAITLEYFRIGRYNIDTQTYQPETHRDVFNRIRCDLHWPLDPGDL